MSSDKEYILEVVPKGTGLVLDLGGNRGILRGQLQDMGYHYINLDCARFGDHEPTLIADAHRLCFKDQSFSLIVSKCTFEHFSDPWKVVGELHRILKDGGHCVIWVPFMHPFHGNDYYRYTPVGLRHIFRDFTILKLESPQQMLTVLTTAAGEAMKRVGLGWLDPPMKALAQRIDSRLAKRRSNPSSYAAAYRIVLHKEEPLAPSPQRPAVSIDRCSPERVISDA